jgi:hypothetical protein
VLIYKSKTGTIFVVSIYMIGTVYGRAILPVVKSLSLFKACSRFQLNQELNEITHTNRYYYADGRTEEKVWRLQKPNLRSIFFEQGPGAFASQQFEAGLLVIYKMNLTIQ